MAILSPVDPEHSPCVPLSTALKVDHVDSFLCLDEERCNRGNDFGISRGFCHVPCANCVLTFTNGPI